MPTIKIESILGGHAPTTHFAKVGQFRASLGIDPAQPIDDLDSAYSTICSGLLRPAASEKFSSTTVNAAPLWLKTNPKTSLVYMVDALGSFYSVNATFDTVTAISDAGELSNGLGNGMEYYDNYIYISKNTTVARYGPLNGTPTLAGDYWVSGISQTAFSNTSYPTTFKNGLQLPNHIMHRHSDGILYIADVVDNKGALHTIKTSFTTAEGDTNNGSTFYKLTFGYGLWPTALESYGSDLVVGLYEGSSAGLRQKHAKIAFWDTTSTNFNKITWVEFPDAIITAIKNVNGVLYVVSGNYQTRGFRVSRFLGGYSFEEVFYSETGEPCLPGAIDNVLNRVVFGSHTNVPESDGCVYAVGLQKAVLSTGMFNIMRATGGNASTNVTAVCFADATEIGFYVPIIGWTNGSGTSSNGLDKQGTTYSNAPPVFWSELYRIGRPFKITKIHVPLAQAVAANMTLNLKIYVDDGQSSFTGSTYGLATINNTAYPNSEKNINMNVADVRGENNFWVELRWTGSSLLTVQLPIIIDFELIPD